MEETRNGLMAISKKMKAEQSMDGIIVRCTKFHLILTEDQYHGLPVLNTTRIHVDGIGNSFRGLTV